MAKRKNSAEEQPATPPTTAGLRREGRLTRIAKALASGATVTDIAEAEGIGRTLAVRGGNHIIKKTNEEWKQAAS